MPKKETIDEKKVPKKVTKKVIKKVKATTGAWWKSSVSEESEPDKPSKITTPPKKTTTPLKEKKTEVAPKEKLKQTNKVSESPEKTVDTSPAKQDATTVEGKVNTRPKRQHPSKRIRPPRKRPQAGRKRVNAGEKTPTNKIDVAKVALETTADERRLKNPAAKRLLKNPRTVLVGNKQQISVRPLPVRASFPGGTSFGALCFAVNSEKVVVTPQKEAISRVDDVKVAEAQTITPKKALDSKTVSQQPHTPHKTVPPAVEEPKVISKLLINAEEPEECRLALLENGKLQSLQVSTVNRTQTKNNIYKARIVAVEPSLQAAFVDYGTDKNGFLPFSEIHPEYYKQNLDEKTTKLIESHQWKRLSIIDVVEKGQEVLVQVVKEEVGKKGANMTTYLSLPGRCVVLMPGSDSTGISRKISGEGKRSELRDTMKSFEIPEGIGWIVRTASIDITETALSRDVGYLIRLWEETKKKGQDLEGVGMVYEDHHAVLRFLREHFDPSIEEILVDDLTALEQVKEFVELLPSAQRNVKVRLHKGSRPIFNQFSVEDQIESIYQPQVNLPSGGSIVIDPTEALVAIDVNSGSTSKGKNFEASIFQANIEAADELARQLRLRDLGGLIVVDFIDMRSNKNIREVERVVKNAMKRDKAKVDFTRISKFGLMQISRQKLGAPIAAGNYRVCEHCKGRGTVRSVETLALFYLRRIQTGASRQNVKQVECHFPLDVSQYLLNNKRNEIHEIEKEYETEIQVFAEPTFKPAQNEIIFNKVEKEENK